MSLTSERTLRMHVVLALLAIGCLIPSAAQAIEVIPPDDITISTIAAGFAWDSLHGTESIATSSPGSHFVIDYSMFPTAAEHIDIESILMSFQCQTPFTWANIVLDSGPTVYSFSPTAPATSSFAFNYYDPLYGTLSGNVPSGLIPQAWKDELDDGTLSGRVWVDGAPWSPQYGIIQTSVSFVNEIPEPASLSLLALGGLALLRRRSGQVLKRRK